jgi:hypothetical protein
VNPLAFRREVLDFAKAAETLMSPVLLDRNLTRDERDFVVEYMARLVVTLGLRKIPSDSMSSW